MYARLEGLLVTEKQMRGTLALVPVEEIALHELRQGISYPTAMMVQAVLKDGAQALEPIELLQVEAGRYWLLRGMREWMAIQRAGQFNIHAVVYADLPQNVIEAKVLQDSDPEADPITFAEHVLAVKTATKKPLTNVELGRRLGLSRPVVSHTLRLLNLSAEVKALARKGRLRAGHLRSLLSIRHVPTQIRVAQHAHDAKWSVKMLEEFLRRMRKGELEGQKQQKDPNIAMLEAQITDALGAKCSLDGKRLIIDFSGGNEVLDGILERLGLVNL